MSEISGRMAARSPIAVDAHIIEGRPQGSRTTLTCLLREVAALGRANEFALYCSDPVLCQERLGVDGFSYVKIPHTGSMKRLLLSLPRYLKASGADKALWQYVLSPFFRGKSYVVIHDVLPFTHPHLFPFLFRIRCQITFSLSMFLANRIIVVSDFSRDAVISLYPALNKKIVVIPNGPSFPAKNYFDEDLPKSRRLRPYVLAVGRIEERKNISLLCQSFIESGLIDVDLVIVGKRDLAISNPLPDGQNIYVLDNVGDEELQELYRGAALFVFPSEAEGFGIPLLDAILFGIPTISSNQTAMPEVAGGAATLFDPTSPFAQVELSSMIKRHFEHAPIAAPSLKQRRERETAFSWRTSATRLVEEIIE